MSRTYRRRGERHDYGWILRDYRWVDGTLVPFHIDARPKEGRRAIARFSLRRLLDSAKRCAILVSAHLRSSSWHL
jgi:hypothetical protein